MFLARPGRGAFQGDRKGNYLHVCLLICPASASGVPRSHFTLRQNPPNNAFLSEPGPCADHAAGKQVTIGMQKRRPTRRRTPPLCFRTESAVGSVVGG